MKILDKISESIEKGDSTSLKELTREALSMNIQIEDILNQGLIKGMDNVGKKFRNNEIFIPEVLIAARAMKNGMNIIKPYLTSLGKKVGCKIVLGTVKGDLHDIGLKIVSMMLEKDALEIVDLGIDVTKDKFLRVIRREKPDIIGMSALLTSTMMYMGEVVEAIERANLRKDVKIIIGGGPVTQSFADEIKADGYAPDAVSAVDLVNSLVNG